MIAWTDERRRVVVELRPGVEAVVPRTRWELVADLLELGRVRDRRRALEAHRVDVPRELVEGPASLRREVAAAIRRQGAGIAAAEAEGRKKGSKPWKSESKR